MCFLGGCGAARRAAMLPRAPAAARLASPRPDRFGMVNIFIIFGLGGLWCMSMGFFDGENVPDFVAKRDDLQYYFKGLAAPEVANETADGDGRDPFAAPEDGRARF